jgi:lipopolysaccharide transport system ATP-binding protein
MTDSNNAIEVRNVSKSFTIYHDKRTTLYEYLIKILEGRRNREKLVVLDNVSFDVYKGEVLGIIGKNGEGKTTLLRILARIFKPDRGSVKINGTTVPFIEIGTGFQTELSAIENIFLYGSLLGFSRKEMAKKVTQILQYAELERFADTKVKNFSAGMYARLAFSIAVQTDPDIMFVDEVLSVGDATFQEKSFNTFKSFRNQGKTIVFVTHNLNVLPDFCDRVMLLNNGKIHSIGKPTEVIEDYRKVIKKI